MVAAARLGVSEPLHAELALSQAAMLERMRRAVPAHGAEGAPLGRRDGGDREDVRRRRPDAARPSRARPHSTPSSPRRRSAEARRKTGASAASLDEVIESPALRQPPAASAPASGRMAPRRHQKRAAVACPGTSRRPGQGSAQAVSGAGRRSGCGRGFDGFARAILLSRDWSVSGEYRFASASATPA